MWIILSYDVNEKRVNKIRKICLQYLIRVQNSVFIGNISWANLRILTDILKREILEEEDSVQFFILRDENVVKRIKMGYSYEFSNIL